MAFINLYKLTTTFKNRNAWQSTPKNTDYTHSGSDKTQSLNSLKVISSDPILDSQTRQESILDEYGGQNNECIEKCTDKSEQDVHD